MSAELLQERVAPVGMRCVSQGKSQHTHTRCGSPLTAVLTAACPAAWTAKEEEQLMLALGRALWCLV